MRGWKKAEFCGQCGRAMPVFRVWGEFCGDKCRRAARAKANPQPALRIADGLNTARLGSAGELLACVDLMKRGYEVFRAVSSSASCDLIALRVAEIKRIEVKVVPEVGGRVRRPTVVTSEGVHFDHLALVSVQGVTYVPELPSSPPNVTLEKLTNACGSLAENLVPVEQSRVAKVGEGVG